jgi:hypothetical protein
MAMSTRTLAKAGELLSRELLVDELQLYNVGQPTTVGARVSRPLSAVGNPVPGLVQSTVLANAAESRTEGVYVVKVARLTDISEGQAVKVLRCAAEPALVGRILLLDKVSLNGLALIRRAVASVSTVVNQEGKEGLA